MSKKYSRWHVADRILRRLDDSGLRMFALAILLGKPLRESLKIGKSWNRS